MVRATLARGIHTTTLPIASKRSRQVGQRRIGKRRVGQRRVGKRRVGKRRVGQRRLQPQHLPCARQEY